MELKPDSVCTHGRLQLSKQNGLLSNVETGSQEIVIFSYVIVCLLHPSMSLNNEKICHKLVKIK